LTSGANATSRKEIEAVWADKRERQILLTKWFVLALPTITILIDWLGCVLLSTRLEKESSNQDWGIFLSV
jgi:hypothetical protein